ncbi:hypothetical protein QP113_02645 [Lactobacillus mulieris]|uniref:Uncharacterized protein n=1 Tax=Lactobacillus jensenii TaxID=109790 RepID=A0ABU9FGX3_LACJE|nr:MULTISPECIES: hypothetical protein [Lactobacillus]MCW8072800.1 helix-turn-helix domain-containing protein [Lactobacillus mulieris]MDK6268398.1 hypothetical protein [Lactobacillus mulieris]MDT9545025.1 hypothetical protein [Lactobacillus jensenii]
MTVIRKKKQSYTVLSNTVIKDERLSWKARGIFAYLMSLPEDWTFHQIEIAKHAKDGRDALRTGMDELQEFGYLKIFRDRDGNGRLGDAVWLLDDSPLPMSGNPILEMPMSENPTQENPQLQITNTTNYLDNKLLIDDEEDARARASKIISQFKKAGLPLAYSGATFKAQIEQLTKLIKETDSETLDELVTLMCDTKIKVDAINYLIAAVKKLKQQSSKTTKYRYRHGKRVEQGTDWTARNKQRAEERAKKAEVDVDLQAIMKNLAQFDPKE